MDDAEEDGYGSEAWGEIDYNDLIAVANEVEKKATPTKPPAPALQTPASTAPAAASAQQLWFTDDDFDDFDDDDMLSAAVPGIAISDELEVVDLTGSVETLRAETPPLPERRVETLRAETPPLPERRVEALRAETSPLPERRVETLRAETPPLPERRVESPSPAARPPGGVPNAPQTPQQNRANVVKRKPSNPLLGSENRARRRVEYSGTIFPRFTLAYEGDLASAVTVAEFSLRLMEVLTSVLREFLVANAAAYPLSWRQMKADEINRMVRHRKADVLFKGWDFLALANIIMAHSRSLPAFVKNPVGVVERLKVLKTTMRWTFAHSSLQEEERKHPMEMSLWAINTLFLIENLGVSMEYAGRVIALHQGLWSRARQPSPPPYVSQDILLG
ncbi:uncharacterized protein H6S33_011809 [Morchella sextelata]|uniref:uncharacterized protein n=1 Tax=Morchella sextelata TaxID=1174677 RepID=UPI001D0478E6|nr:uncharacterized protein H6S33_011809 [Morchella sextelata]KAH0610282.1 hypothetical protein H6S33_011809 [Morchella sextelata]